MTNNVKNWFPVTNDVVFKTFFTDKDNLENLKFFLCAILNIDIQKVTYIGVTNSEITPEYADGKVNRLDILLKFNDQNINIEMQNCKYKNFVKRVLFYWSKMYANSLEAGQDYNDLKSSISINILNYKMFDETKDFMSSFSIYEDQRKELLTDVLHLYFLELPKVDQNVEVNNKTKLWLQFFNARDKEDLDMFNNTDVPEIQKAIKTLNTINEDEHLRALAWAHEKAELDYLSGMRQAEIDGREAGRAEGRAEGKEEGKEEKSVEIAISLLKQGQLTIDSISSVTGLSVEKIQELQKEN